MKGRDKTPEIIRADPLCPEEEAAARAAEVVLSGKIIGFPTDTVYGLGADALNPEAVKLLYMIKGRDAAKPTLILISCMEDLSFLASSVSDKARRLMEKFWPGPLTIVLRAAASVPGMLTAGTGTIGIRMPASRLCSAIIGKAGRPLTAPSANPQGKPPARTAREMLEYFRGEIDLVIDGGESVVKTPSTVVDASGENISILREGGVSAREIEEALP